MLTKKFLEFEQTLKKGPSNLELCLSHFMTVWEVMIVILLKKYCQNNIYFWLPISGWIKAQAETRIIDLKTSNKSFASHNNKQIGSNLP